MPMRPGETPVPIPNTTVKTREADGTALETMWESRWAPDQRKKQAMLVHIETDTGKGVLPETER